jgi:hypothetical protein
MTTSQIGETEVPVSPESPEAETSVLINISTPASPTPICRLGTSQEILGEFTVRQLIEKIVNPKSLFSVGVPMSQLEAESPTALAISELLAGEGCEVVVCGPGEQERRASSHDLARAAAQPQTGAQGSSFLKLNLEVRRVRDNVPPGGLERRQVTVPQAVEAAREGLAAGALAGGLFELGEAPLPQAAVEATAQVAPAEPEKAEAQAEAAPAPAADGGIVAIVAGRAPRKGYAAATGEKKEYIRKADFLRAQFLPEVDALNFTGLFVGNLGFGIREEQGRRQVVLADPARITDILLRGNGHRRAGEHAKALICYQELVDMDPGNPDFRFLLGKTLLELGQVDQATEALARAKELGHEGAAKEMDNLRRSGVRSRRAFGFLRFWKQ